MNTMSRCIPKNSITICGLKSHSRVHLGVTNRWVIDLISYDFIISARENYGNINEPQIINIVKSQAAKPGYSAAAKWD